MQRKQVRIGLLGCGNVGAPLVHLIREEGEAIAARTGMELQVNRIAVRSVHRDRDLPALAEGTLTTDARAVVADPDVDLVVELIGGIEPARELILAALANGKPVVTGNKELLANHGVELFAAAEAAERDLLFEAAVGGGIPLVRAVRESLLGEPVTRIMGIVNGTTNYILSQMADAGASYADALADAQGKGYAERDPTADVEGYDAGAKIAILASIAFGAKVVAGDVYHEGISTITEADIEFARKLGYAIKLLAITERVGDVDGMASIAVRVHPAMVPTSHPLASVRDSFNAVFIEGGSVGELMLYGRGAGGRPTASAVLGDVLDAAGNLLRGSATPLGSFGPAVICPIDELQSAYYLNLEVSDRPGVLAQVAGAFGERKVSIRSMEQEGLGDEARLVFITHHAREADVQATLHALRRMDSVRQICSLLRVIS